MTALLMLLAASWLMEVGGMKYRLKNLVVEAVKWNGVGWASFEELPSFLKTALHLKRGVHGAVDVIEGRVILYRRGGTLVVEPGSWLISLGDEDIHTCGDSMFHKLFTPEVP